MDEPVSHPYELGKFYDVMPVPAVAERCVGVDAGPVRFEVESRRLTNELLYTALPGTERNVPAGTVFDDGGATLHVLGADDGLEHLRFDCFEHEPHYHYLMHARGGNVVCRIDDVAIGDPVAWTVGRVSERLPEMLEHAGAADLAAAVRREKATVAAGVRLAAELLERAR